MSPQTAQLRGGVRLAGNGPWLAAIAVSAAAAGAFTLVIRANDLLPGERTLTRWLHDLDVPGVSSVVNLFDFISNDDVAPVVFLLLLPVVWLAWGRYAALTYFATGAVTGLTRVADLASRPRPTGDLRWTDAVFGSGGYPSGHVVYAMLVFGTLAYLAGRRMTPGRGRTALRVALVASVIAMGPARVIELDHWAMDVVGSYLLAAPFLLTAMWLHPRLPSWLERAPRLRTLIGADGSL